MIIWVANRLSAIPEEYTLKTDAIAISAMRSNNLLPLRLAAAKAIISAPLSGEDGAGVAGRGRGDEG